MNARTRELKLQDRCRDFSWILEQYEAGNLSISGSSFTKASFDKFRMAVKCVNEVYENQWDIDIRVIETTGEHDTIDIQGIVIYFESLTLTNTTRNTHTISDLYVKIHIGRDGSDLLINGLSGGRMKISYAEYCSGYMHSHLPGGFNFNGSNSNAPFWRNFCRGSGHINDFIAEINGNTLTKERMLPFLIQITGLVSWESLEGGPHRRYSQIRVSSNRGRISSPSQTDSNWLKNQVLDYHRENQQTPDVEFKLESGQYTIVDNERFVKFLTETVELDDTAKRRVICMEDNAGNYYQYGSTPGYDAPPVTTQHKYIFQGVEHTFEIASPPDVGDLSNINYFLHPNVKSFIKQELEYEVNIKKVRESTIRRYSNQTSDARESTASN